MDEIRFWQEHFHEFNGAPLWPDTKIDTLLFTDASDIGWGGYNASLGGKDIAQGYFLK